MDFRVRETFGVDNNSANNGVINPEVNGPGVSRCISSRDTNCSCPVYGFRQGGKQTPHSVIRHPSSPSPQHLGYKGGRRWVVEPGYHISSRSRR
ncbi:hypothetical protein J6590_015933 [Homalodisca vitripennis]|nr:hypothetical protein J6590_015933 [Homalodisca vitripennis]